MQHYTDEFYRLVAILGVQEEEKLLVLKYINGLSQYIQQEMEFLTVKALADAFHYTMKLEAKQKGKACFTDKQTGRKSDKKSLVDCEQSKNPSQPTLPNIDYHKNKFQKDKKDRNKKYLTRIWRDYHNSTWYDILE